MRHVGCYASWAMLEAFCEASAIARGTIKGTKLGQKMMVESLMQEQGKDA